MAMRACGGFLCIKRCFANDHGRRGAIKDTYSDIARTLTSDILSSVRFSARAYGANTRRVSGGFGVRDASATPWYVFLVAVYFRVLVSVFNGEVWF